MFSNPELKELYLTDCESIDIIDISSNPQIEIFKYNGCRVIDLSNLKIGAYVWSPEFEGVVFSKLESIMKIVSADETKTDWENAHDWCNGKGKLPSFDELQQIYDEKEVINNIFAKVGEAQLTTDRYWSTKTSHESATWNIYHYAHGINFSDGSEYSTSYGDICSVRAVRVL